KESSNNGTDTVVASIDYSISKYYHVENLVLIDYAWDGTGNYRDNQIKGNINHNILNGNNGNDTLNGNEGWDIITHTTI
ncbi:MAG: calcium-binding protein, partial [Cyanobacteria bacterium J06635_10]